jgi:hypothetical protein
MTTPPEVRPDLAALRFLPGETARVAARFGFLAEDDSLICKDQ